LYTKYYLAHREFFWTNILIFVFGFVPLLFILLISVKKISADEKEKIYLSFYENICLILPILGLSGMKSINTDFMSIYNKYPHLKKVSIIQYKPKFAAFDETSDSIKVVNRTDFLGYQVDRRTDGIKRNLSHYVDSKVLALRQKPQELDMINQTNQAYIDS